MRISGLFRRTFARGIHPSDNKATTKDREFIPMPTGARVYLPLSQHIGAPAVPLVVAGTEVKVGSLIGRASGFVSNNVHSSVSGKVVGFEARENAQGNKITHIVIENDGKYEEELLPPLVDPTPEQIVERCKACGIAGMGGATFPTHIKLTTKSKINTVIINGSECEPYITTDDRLMRTKQAELFSGFEFIRKALNAKDVKIGIEDNKPTAIKAMRSACPNENYKVYALRAKYPQGGEKQLIYSIERKKVPNGGLPSDIGYIVLNISTAYAIYEACALGRASHSRFMTVSGGGVKNPQNIYVRFGVPFSEIADFLGYSYDIVKVISGGPMMGVSEANLNMVASKGSSALLLLTHAEIREVTPTVCIKCRRCNRVCPINLMPMMTDMFVLMDDFTTAKKYHPTSCIECGCCAYVCPARRPLVQSQRLAKKIIRERKL